MPSFRSRPTNQNFTNQRVNPNGSYQQQYQRNNSNNHFQQQQMQQQHQQRMQQQIQYQQQQQQIQQLQRINHPNRQPQNQQQMQQQQHHIQIQQNQNGQTQQRGGRPLQSPDKQSYLRYPTAPMNTTAAFTSFYNEFTPPTFQMSAQAAQKFHARGSYPPQGSSSFKQGSYQTQMMIGSSQKSCGSWMEYGTMDDSSFTRGRSDSVESETTIARRIQMQMSPQQRFPQPGSVDTNSFMPLNPHNSGFPRPQHNQQQGFPQRPQGTPQNSGNPFAKRGQEMQQQFGSPQPSFTRPRAMSGDNLFKMNLDEDETPRAQNPFHSVQRSPNPWSGIR